MSALIRSATLGLMSALLLGQGACRTTGPPVTPPPHNAVLLHDLLLAERPDLASRAPVVDARVLARCRSWREFGQRRRGDQVESWQLIVCDVLRVEHGSWSESELSFIYCETGPAYWDGTIDMAQLPQFHRGAEWIFELDTRARPAVIVHQLAPPSSTQPMTRAQPASVPHP
jgi:hypothetical protein